MCCTVTTCADSNPLNMRLQSAPMILLPVYDSEALPPVHQELNDAECMTVRLADPDPNS